MDEEIKDMKTTLTRMFTVAVLMMVSLGAKADVKVLYGEKGTELQPAKNGTITLGQKELTGGTIIISQVEQKDGTTNVTFAVTPDKNYKLAEDGLEVYAVIPTDISPTRGLEVSTALTLKSEDFKDEASKRTYTTTIDSKLNLWLKSADFLPTGRKAVDANNLFFIKSYADNNNYYLCPAIGCYYGNNIDQPHLTTFQTGGDQNSVWEIVPVENETDTYYIIHYKTGKYLKSNEGFSIDNGNNRKAVHLEKPNELDDYFKFCIKKDNNNNYYQIYPKKYDTDQNGVKNMSLNMRGGNKNFYVPQDGSSAGIIGLYQYSGQAGSRWTLQQVASASIPCATPIIKYDGDNINISYPYTDETGITIYYTTDGTQPTTSSSSRSSTSFNIPASGIVKVRAFAAKSEFVNSDEAVLWGSARPFLIQSKEDKNYYLVPAGNGTNVNTSSLAGEAMQWTLQNAGSSTGGTPYYFLVNCNDNKIKYNDNNTFSLDQGTDDANRFCIIEDGSSDEFFIIPVNGVSVSTNMVCKNASKNSGNVANNNVDAQNVTANNNDNINRSHWKFIVCNVSADQKDLFSAPPFSVSDADEAHYYLIQSLGNSGYYIMPPSATDGYVQTSNSSSNYSDVPWVFKKAAEDNWLTYYYIINAATGQFMHFNLNDKLTGEGTNVVSMKDISEKNTVNEDKFQYVMVPSTTTGAYYIVPKGYSYADDSHINFKDNKYYGLWENSGNALKTTWSRVSSGNNVKWTFSEKAPLRFYIDPDITQDENGDVTISHLVNACDFYYTTDGTTTPVVPADGSDPVAPTYKYSGPFLPPLGVSKIIAKAAIKGDHSITSNPVELEFSALAQPTITFDNATSTVTITSLSGATIYYAYGSTDPADPTVDDGVTHGDSPVTFTVSEKTYIKALAVKGGFTTSAVQSATIDKVAAPVTDTTSDGKVKLTSTTPSVTIYYEIGEDESSVAMPSTSSTRYTGPIQNVSGKVIKAIAVKDGWITSDVGGSNGIITLQCAMPVIRRGTGNTFTISSSFPAEGVSIYYTTDSGDPTTLYEGPVSISRYPVTVKAIATADGYSNSSLSEVTIIEDLVQEGDYYLISSAGDFEKFVSKASTADGAGYKYKVTDDFTYSSTFEITQPFTGTFEGTAKEDGAFCVISGLRNPLFSETDGAIIMNVMLKDVQISGSGAKGAIAGIANGYTRIYNCGILPSSNKFESETSAISSSDSYCGGLVGALNDDSRVVNCFSYAKITGGTVKAGIVGYNQTASTAEVSNGKYENLKTMVVNCMFYGDITGSTGSVYPVYGGSKILNTGNNGINNYNYYRSEASLTPTDYYCSWPASEENLTRFEYYRYLLNSNRELCGWWVGASSAPSGMSTTDVQAVAKDASLMAKWVLDPALAPYPILKSFGKYPSVINLDPDERIDSNSKTWVSRVASSNTIETNAAPDTDGQTLGTISVTINGGSHHSGSDSRTINITAMDIDNNDFCYGKIQLPYYNDIFGDPDGTTWSEKYGDNYTEMVVTGWDITTSEGTTGTFSEDPITGYNFADRNCTAKDTHRTFAQGGYYYVPYGVTSITITAHWANAYYLSNTDGNYERVFFSDGSNNKISAGKPFTPAGTRSFGSDEFGGQTINSGTISNALSYISTTSSVYDCAIVLVGNYQYRSNTEDIADNNRKSFTLMTVDLDFDNEPDYCFEWQFGGGAQGVTRAWINPVRFDFLPIVELGIAMKENGSKYLFAIGKLTPYGHFEITETALIHMGQFEYDDKNRNVAGPVILNNGTFDQICRGSESDDDQNVNYFILGGHVKMPSFTPGSHVRTAKKSRHCAVNVLGGEITYFYLSGNYNANPTNEGNPHCYIDGGKLDFVASGAKEQIVGDVFWEIDHAYIGEFYGGGISADKHVKGNISITINRSKVTKFCGGPQFGDMESGKTVTTEATGTTFGVFYGAGNGGTCYSQFYTSDFTSANPDWETVNLNVSGGMNQYIAYTHISQGYHAKYELEMINSSAGTMNNAVCRTYMYAAQFATTNTGDVTSTLTDCTIEGNFFGGGLLGGVMGNVKSTLLGQTVVRGSVYGGGYGIADLTVDVLPKGNTESTKYTAPQRDANTSVITAPQYPTPTTYIWTHNTTFGNTTLSTSSPAIINPNGDGKNYLYTEIALDDLGKISGNVKLTIKGNTRVEGNVFGGGDNGVVQGSTEVNIE